MKNLIPAAVTILLLTGVLHAQTIPESREGRAPAATVLARVGFFSPSDDYFKSIYGSAIVPGVEGRIRFLKNLFVSVEGGYFKKEGALTLTGEKTTLTIFPLDVTAAYQFRATNVLLSYVGAGISVCPYRENNVLGDDKGTGFGPVFYGGITARLNSLAIDAKVKYSSVKIKPFDLKADLGGLSLSLGFGVTF